MFDIVLIRVNHGHYYSLYSNIPDFLLRICNFLTNILNNVSVFTSIGILSSIFVVTVYQTGILDLGSINIDPVLFVRSCILNT